MPSNILIFFSLSGAINAVTSTVLAIIVYKNNKHSIVNKSYALFAFFVALWSYTYIFWPLAQNKESCLFWFRVLHIGAIFIPVSFYHFVISFLNKKNRRPIMIGYGLAFLFLAFSFSKYFIADMKPILFLPYYGVPGLLYIPFLVMFFAYTIRALYILFSGYKASNEPKKSQILLVGLGTLIGFIGGSNNFLLWFNIPFPPYLNIFVSVYVIMTAYAIVKHRFLDIKVIVKKTLVYSILISLITILYFIIVYLLERVSSVIVGYQSMSITIAIIVFFTLLFTPLKNKIQHYVDRRFFKGTIDQIDHEKHLLEGELQRSERLKTVSTLAAGMAHEIKNPLTSIKTFVEYEGKKHQDPEFRKKFESIVPKEIDKIANIINQLLDYSKTDRVNLKSCSLHDILDYVLDLYSNEFIKNHINIQKEYKTKCSNITCDENQLKQAFINIVLNSMEAMPNGGVLTIKTQAIDNILEITIKDTGPGIPKDKLKDIFNPFYTTKDKGTGLGLFIVHQIIENNRGTITMESEVGKGTVVKIGFRGQL